MYVSLLCVFVSENSQKCNSPNGLKFICYIRSRKKSSYHQLEGNRERKRYKAKELVGQLVSEMLVNAHIMPTLPTLHLFKTPLNPLSLLSQVEDLQNNYLHCSNAPFFLCALFFSSLSLQNAFQTFISMFISVRPRRKHVL